MAEVVKEVKGQGKLSNQVIAREYDDGTIQINLIRMSHPNIAKPYRGKNDKGVETAKFGVVSMLPKATHAPAKDLIVDYINRMLKENKVDPKTFPPEKKFIRNGDQAGKEEYIGHWLVSSNEERRPSVRNANKERLRDETEIAELFYGGAWGSVLIRPWFQNSKEYGKRANAGLTAIQFVRHDEAFGQGRISDDEIDDRFESYEDEENGGFDDGDDGLGGDDDMGGL